LTEEEIIKRTIFLAKKGRGNVSPNPLVGAVIVKDSQIIGEGFHRVFGERHAEVEAIRSAKQDVSGASLYVNLEPCSHHGKQPPCVEAVLRAGISRVIIGMRDPNPEVNGRGIQQLQQNGVTVKVGLLERECEILNEAFIKHSTTGLPFQTIKIAQTLDGKIAAANGRSNWITCEESRRRVHKLRVDLDAVLVGIGTVLVDDPQLNVRFFSGRHPKRIILDSKLRIPLRARVLNDDLTANTIIVTTEKSLKLKRDEIESLGAQIWQIDSNTDGMVDLKKLTRRIGSEGMNSVLIEGGSQIFSAYLEQNLIDKVLIFIAPKIFGNGLNAVKSPIKKNLSNMAAFKNVHYEQVGVDMLFTGYLN